MNGSVTTASDGYGLHFAKVESDGSIKHYLVGNDGVELTAYRGTISSSGTYPVLNVNAGKLRAVFNIGTEMKVYQSTDGGVNWNQINSQFIFTEGTINFIDATTDGYGTHIVWQDREQFTNNPRVFYYRWDDNAQQWRDYKNVSDLSASPSHKKPKVATTASEAQVAFMDGPAVDNGSLTSRDLNLSSGIWEGSYAVASGNAEGLSINIAALGSKLYATIHSLLHAQQSPPEPVQYVFIASRDVSSLSWQVDSSPLTSTRIAPYYDGKNLLATVVGGVPTLYFLNTCFVDLIHDCTPQGGGVQLWTKVEGQPWSSEVLATQGGEGLGFDHPMLSVSMFGAYSVWNAYFPHGILMRRKPFAITGTISERTLLTGNNWVSGQSARLDYYQTADAMPNSITNVFDNSWLTINGTLNAQQASQFKFGQDARLIVYSKLNTNGTASQPAVFTYLGPYRWTGITVATGVSLNQLNYCNIDGASTGIAASYSKLNIDHSTISNCLTGLSLFGMTGVKYYCNLTNSTITAGPAGSNGAYIECSEKVVFHSNNISGGSGIGASVALGASPRFYFNAFNSNAFGVWVSGQSSPRFGDYIVGDKGGNTLYNNTGTPLVVYGSNPFLGLSDNGIMGGANCFNTNSNCYVNALSENGIPSVVIAQKNFWTDVPPIASKFCVSGGSTIDYDKWLSSCEPDWSPVKGGGREATTYLLTDRRLTTARKLRGQRNYTGAAAVYTTLVAQQDIALAQVALAELRDTYTDWAAHASDETHRRTMQTYLRGQMANHSSPVVKRIAKGLNALELMQNEDFSSAETEYRQLLSTASTSDQRRTAVYGLFNLSALGARNRAGAALHLAQLRRDWPNDSETKNALLRFASMPEGTGLTKPGSSDRVQEQEPTGFALEQNYPNPFNPSTTIRFAIPQTEHVTLKVYDLLGREVATLVSEVQGAGFKSVEFDASHLASGVYIYKLTAGTYSASRKLIVMK